MGQQIKCLLLTALVVFSGVYVDAYFLSDNFYYSSCPNAESVISSTVSTELDKNLKLAAGIIRLQFHDCFVEGCDASVLLDGSDSEKQADVNENLAGFDVIDTAKAAVEAICPGVVSCADVLAYAARDSTVKGCDGSVLLNSTTTNQAEREAHVNFGLRGVEEVDEIKAALEYVCPGVVSCADILILAARDATYKAGGPRWPVALGRRDGNVSVDLLADGNLPFPVLNFSGLVDNFARKKFNAREMVVLSGIYVFALAIYISSQSRDT